MSFQCIGNPVYLCLVHHLPVYSSFQVICAALFGPFKAFYFFLNYFNSSHTFNPIWLYSMVYRENLSHLHSECTAGILLLIWPEEISHKENCWCQHCAFGLFCNNIYMKWMDQLPISGSFCLKILHSTSGDSSHINLRDFS